MGSIHVGAGPTCEDAGAAERSCYGLTTAPIPHPLALRRVEGRTVEESGMKEQS